MTKTHHLVFKGLMIVAWAIFIGLSIEAGGLIVNFFFSLYKPEVVQNLYQKLDLTGLYYSNTSLFFGLYSFILPIAVLKAVLFYTVVRLMHKMNLSQPFDSFVAKHITQLSYYTLSIGFLSYIGRQYAKNELKNADMINSLREFWADSQAFIIMGAIIYIIATIFQKGVELQNENDLTV